MVDRPRVSPSQISRYEDCARKWGYTYIEGIREPSSKAQVEGKRLHGKAEALLRDGVHPGTDSDGKLIAAAMRPGYLPIPRPGLLVEYEFELPVAREEFSFYGFIDCLVPPDESGVAVVVDHKFVKDLKWAKSDTQLRDDVQSTIYQWAAIHSFDVIHGAESRWIYYQKGSTKIQKAACHRTRGEIGRALLPIIDTARELVQLRRKGDMASLPGNPDACEAYGGCHYRNICPAYGGRKMFTFAAKTNSGQIPPTGDLDMSMMEQLKALKQRNGKGVPAKPETKTAEVESPKVAAKKPGFLKGVNPPKEPEVEAASEAPPIEIAAEPIEKKKVGRPRKVEASKAVVEFQGQEIKGLGRVTVPAKHITVMFNCAVVKTNGDAPPTQLIELLAPIAKQVAEDAAVEHWAAIEYGGGKTKLASAFSQWLEESAWTGTIYANERSAETQAVLEVLNDRAHVVIRALA